MICKVFGGMLTLLNFISLLLLLTQAPLFLWLAQNAHTLSTNSLIVWYVHSLFDCLSYFFVV